MLQIDPKYLVLKDIEGCKNSILNDKVPQSQKEAKKKVLEIFFNHKF